MLLQFIWTAESADVADFYLLTRLQCRIESDIRARNRFDDGWMSRLCPGASMSLALCVRLRFGTRFRFRSEEHTSELQSPCNLVCRLLLEKKNPATDPPAPNAR